MDAYDRIAQYDRPRHVDTALEHSSTSVTSISGSIENGSSSNAIDNNIQDENYNERDYRRRWEESLENRPTQNIRNNKVHENRPQSPTRRQKRRSTVHRRGSGSESSDRETEANRYLEKRRSRDPLPVDNDNDPLFRSHPDVSDRKIESSRGKARDWNGDNEESRTKRRKRISEGTINVDSQSGVINTSVITVPSEDSSTSGNRSAIMAVLQAKLKRERDLYDSNNQNKPLT
ncbi:hypothetical protein BGZ76_009510 [Entomortierella beljakovae]|nr:hypothetical protein BGZ76_009510 [Entomortierella beljakovae]